MNPFTSRRVFVRVYLPTLLALAIAAILLTLHMVGIIAELPAMSACACCLMVISLNGLSVYVPIYLPPNAPEIEIAERRWHGRWLARILTIIGFAETMLVIIGFDRLTHAKAPEAIFTVGVIPWLALMAVLWRRSLRVPLASPV